MFSSNQKIHVLLDDLITWAKAQSSGLNVNFQKLNISIKINQAIQLLEQGIPHKSLVIEQYLQANEVTADKVMLLAILRNLIANAIKFSEEGSKIIISSYVSNHNIYIKVQDFGVGMSEERRITILNGHESYTSTGTHGEKGTGLGLSIVKDFIERQKGTLLIESAMVNGSSLYIKWSLHTISFIALFADSHHCISINFLLSFTSPDPLYFIDPNQIEQYLNIFSKVNSR